MNTFSVVNQGVVMKGYLKTAEVAERFGVDPRTILRWVKSGYFPGSKKLNPMARNSPLLIPEQSVQAFEEKQTEVVSEMVQEGEDN
ncbi:MAG: helix-turn-helix domain-containing protein [Anaerolineae bacterium]|nr:helix-turn-helix domain-containing protein [Anaerolineae bacterium]